MEATIVSDAALHIVIAFCLMYAVEVTLKNFDILPRDYCHTAVYLAVPFLATITTLPLIAEIGLIIVSFAMSGLSHIWDKRRFIQNSKEYLSSLEDKE